MKLSLIPPSRGRVRHRASSSNHLAELPVPRVPHGRPLAVDALPQARAGRVGERGRSRPARAGLRRRSRSRSSSTAVAPSSSGSGAPAKTGRPFRMLKFRTMVADAEALLPDLVPFDKLAEPMFKLSNDPRVTRVGQVPPALEPRRAPAARQRAQGRHEPRRPASRAGRARRALLRRAERVRLAVKPGLTGPMQVYGRGLLTLLRALGGRARLRREPVARQGSPHHRNDPRGGSRAPGRLLASSPASHRECVRSTVPTRPSRR